MQEEVGPEQDAVSQEEALNEILDPVWEWADDFDYGNEVHSTAQEDLGPHECLPAPECLEDRPKPQQQELVQVELEPENVKQTRRFY